MRIEHNTAASKVLHDNHEVIARNRAEISAIMNGETDAILGVAGACSTQLGTAHVREGRSLVRRLDGPGLYVVSRMGVYKPRTKDDDWKGMEVSDPDAALYQVAHSVRMGTPTMIEAGEAEHIRKYGPLLSAMWYGARSHNIDENVRNRLHTAAAVIAPDIPLGIKNELSGGIEQALDAIGAITEMRNEHSDKPAPVVLIYRGGTAVTTPEQWMIAVGQASDATRGRMILDVAHGSEMAHDPGKNMQKSEEGQVEALKSTIKLVKKGLSLAGVMVETSDVVIDDPRRMTDPNIRIDTCVEHMRDLTTALRARRDEKLITC